MVCTVLTVTAEKIFHTIRYPAVYGNVHYVGGSGPNNFTKIQDAVDNASDWDTVFVYDDSSPYYESVDVNKSISLIGEDRNSTVIDGGVNDNVVYITASCVNLSGFTITNSGVNWLEHNGILLSSGNNHIFDNIISLNEGFGIRLYSDDNVISCNIISNNFYGIFLYDCSNNIFSENIMSYNNWGISLQKSTNNVFVLNEISFSVWDGVKLSSWSHHNVFTKNHIISNNWSGISLILCNRNNFSNNNIENNGVGLGLLDGHLNEIKYNNFIGNELDARFQDAYGNRWDGNFWDRGRILPQCIFGILILIGPPAHGPGFALVIPWINIDWRPAGEPYDIGGAS